MGSNQASNISAVPPRGKKRKQGKIQVEDDEKYSVSTVAAYSKILPRQQMLAGLTAPPTHTKDPELVEGFTSTDESDGSIAGDIGPELPPSDCQPPDGGKEDNTRTLPNIGQENSDFEDMPPKGNLQQRDEWMVLPPSKGSWMSNIDPTSLRSRKFSAGKSARTSSTDRSGSGATWTENIAQKKIRLENEVMGIQDMPRINQHQHQYQGQASRSSALDNMTTKRIELFNEKKKATSLYKAKEGHLALSDDEPSSRPFDKEKDITEYGTMTSGNRREMLRRAGDYSSRFAGGNYL